MKGQANFGGPGVGGGRGKVLEVARSATILLRTPWLMSVDKPTANHPKRLETVKLLFSYMAK